MRCVMSRREHCTGHPLRHKLPLVAPMIRTILLAIVISIALATGSWAQSARDIIAAADKVRNPAEPFRSTTTLTEYVRGQPKDSTTLVVYSKEDKASGQFRNLVRYVEPPRDAGKMALLDGQNLWFYDPAAKSSVRISAQQRLIGQAAIGDVLTVNFAVDYAGTLLGDETISDAEKQQRNCWHLDLRAATPTAVYSRAEYWVEKGTFHPVKTKFWSDSGRILKVLYYREFVQRLGAVRPGSAVIIDAVDSTLVTTVRFDNPTFQDIPDFWYQRDYLPRLRPE
jgi:outer membrane lipoprotein-sorting protein